MNIQVQKEYLYSISNRESREYWEGLRTLLQGTYRCNLADISQLIDEFQEDILKHGVFYIDIINQNLLFMLRRSSLLPPLQVSLFLLVIETLLPVCNRKTIGLLHFFCKKVDKKNTVALSEIASYRKAIQARLEKIELEMKSMVLHSYEDIFREYRL